MEEIKEKTISFSPSEINYYTGRFTYETFLFKEENQEYCPNKGDFIAYDDVIYKVLYVMLDFDSNKVEIFLRETVEEDY